jgi:PqqD family protein of HPr-rel-A system
MWRVSRGQLLDYREWDEQFVLYNNLSGDTHLLGPDAIEILLRLKDRGIGTDALVAALCSAWPDDDAQQLAHDVATLLHQLKGLHLIEQVA